MQNIRWAVLGTGVIANEMAVALKKNGRNIDAVGNRTHEKAVAFAEKYGINNQIIKLMEECGELITAAAKYDPQHRQTIEHIAEEAGDVRIMLMQIEYLLGIQTTVQENMNKKINRQINRMKEKGLLKEV